MPRLDFRTAPLAIVGAACRFPGADTLEQFWELIAAGRSSYGPLPDERLNRRHYYHPQRGTPGKSYTATGGVVPLRPIDPTAGLISGDIAARYDLLPLNLCEVVAAACRHAGYDPQALPFRRAGVYIGNSSGSDCEADHVCGTFADETARLLDRVDGFRNLPADRRAAVIAEVAAALAHRYPRRKSSPLVDITPGAAAAAVANVLRTTGPCLVADAACASSFMALKLAADALHAGEIDAALVGTAAYRNWYEYVLMSLAQSISAGESFPFDARAAGLIAADGLAAIVVKTLPQAQADGDRILGVVRGLGVSTDGRGKSFWAPRREGQVAAIQRAYENGVDPAGIQYIEAHATSTQVGDATEMESLAEALGPKLRGPVPVGSVKGNIGHTLEAAGMASLIKVLLAMQHGTVPPVANFASPNPAIPWTQIPFRIPRTAEAWPAPADGSPRRAAIDSFGIGGLNTHLVVDQAPEANAASVAPATEILSGSQWEDPIAIVGIGCVLPGAVDATAFRERLRQPTGGHSDADGSSSDTDAPRTLAGWEFDWKRHKIPPKQVAQANPLHFALLEAADQALRDAGWTERPFERSRTGVAVGSIFTGDFADDTYLGCRLPETTALIGQTLARHGVEQPAAEAIVRDYSATFLQQKPAARDDTASLSCSTLASRLSKHFDLGGGALSLDAGDGSGLAALAAAVGLLRSGASDTVICAAGQRWVDRVALETATADAGWIGRFVPPGEGTVALVLKPLAAARRDGDRIHGVLSEVIGECRHELSDATRAHGAAADASRTAAHLESAFGHLYGAAGLVRILAAVVDPQPSAREIEITARRSFVQGGAVWRAVLEPEEIDSPRAETRASIHEKASDGGRDKAGFAVAGPPDSTDECGGPAPADGLVPPCVPGRGSSLHEPRHQQPDRTMNAQQLPPTNGTTNGRLRTNGSTAQRDEIAQFLVAYVAEHNGFPVEVIDRDADLETALQFGADQIPELLEEACRHFGGDIAVCRRELRHTHSLTLAAIETALCRALATSGGHAPAAVEKPCPSSDSEPAVSVVPEAERVMRRLVLRAVDAPLPVASQNQRSLNGSFALLGQNAAADALHERLTAAGVAVHRLPADSAVAAVAALDALWQQGPVLNLVLATARDEDAAIDLGDPAAWERRQEAGIMLPLLVCQRWFTLVSQTHQLETASVTAVTALGGDFGLTGHGAAVEGSGLAGLLKALEVETRGRLRAKVIDTFPRDPAKLIASEVLGELTADAGDVEVGYIRGKRYVLKAVPQPASTLARRPAPPQGTWVVTGGARGVTAVVARELGRQYGLRLHLLGTTAPPPIAPEWLALDEAGRKELRARIVREALAAKKNPQAEWGRIEKGLEMEAAFQSLREAGVEFTYHACDVADRMQLAAVLEAIRAQDGPITGILHGAGSETAGRFEKKTRDGMARVLASKAEGTAALIALTRHDPLQHFIGFGSTSGRFGAYVNADYALANNLLAGLLDRLQYERPDLRAFTVHWTAWSDVGMGARDRSRFILDAIQVRGMPPLEGAAHLIDELEAATSDPEIVICDHPDGVHSSHLTMPTAGEWSAMQARQSPIHDAPLIDTVVRPDTGGATAFLTLDPVRDPFLNGHMDNGVPLLPAVIGIESSAEAASLISGMRTVVGLRDVKLLNGFRMAEPRRHHARIRVTLDGDTAACQLSGEFYDKSGRMTDPDRLFQSCVVELADAPRPLATPNFGPLPESGWIEVPYPDDWRAMEGANSGTVFYGPELRSLKAVWHDAAGAWGRLVAPPVGEIGGTRLGSHWHTPPSIIDALLFACDLFASYSFGTKQLPHVIDHVAIARLPRTGENCLSRILYRGRDGNRYTWDFWLLGDGGDVILSCEGCHFVDLNIAVATMPR